MADSGGVPTRQSVRSQRLSARRGVRLVLVDFVLHVCVLAVSAALRRVPELSPQGCAGEGSFFVCLFLLYLVFFCNGLFVEPLDYSINF